MRNNYRDRAPRSKSAVLQVFVGSDIDLRRLRMLIDGDLAVLLDQENGQAVYGMAQDRVQDVADRAKALGLQSLTLRQQGAISSSPR